jgi:stage II sporulation protein R
MRKLTIYLCTCALVLVMSWEYQRGVSASVVTDTSVIPEEAMRLRILANSDTAQDQWLKREIRDEVVQEITNRVIDLKDIDQAREKVQLSLDDIDKLVKEVIKSRGFTYSAEIEYGEITFPSKLYGNKLYPAGQYEGLLITIGAGQGDNWWCVLFPPLCFVDFGTGEAVNPDQAAQKKQSVAVSETASTTAEADIEGKAVAVGESDSDVEVRFFLVDIFQKIKALFA